MGDLPLTSTPDVRPSDQSQQKTEDAEGETPSHDEQRIALGHGPSQPHHYPPGLPYAFTAQFDMSQAPSVHRPGPYNMAQMTNSPPHVAFRPGQYPHVNQQQQRYHLSNSPSMMQHMSQFMGHQTVQMPGQGYYVQQPHMGQYYETHHLPQHQPGPAIPPRQAMEYYPNQMIMNQQASAYYYPPTQYIHSTHAMPNTMMPSQFMSPAPATNDTRATFQSTPNSGVHSPPPNQGQGRLWKQPLVKPELSHGPDGTERRQSTVRGPPRKPRQSGEEMNFDGPFSLS